MLFSVLCLTLALTVPASALDYNIDGPGDPEYGKSTSIEPVVTADRGEMPNVDVSKNVIMYRIIQSFKPGEVSPEEANRIGYELAMKFTGGQHQFVVSTHVDKKQNVDKILGLVPEEQEQQRPER